MPTRHVFALGTFDAEVVADLAAADEETARVWTSLSGRTFSKAGLPNSATGEMASGWRSIDFGVNTTRGLRQERIA